MKKLGKLVINPDKLMKNEELVNLRGGYDLDLCSFGAYGCVCCEANGQKTCSTDTGFLDNWCSIWAEFGYSCNCYQVYYT